MKLVKAKEIEIPPFGLFIKRAIIITCGACGSTFKDKPEIGKHMRSLCPFCNAVNELPITKA
jgi:rubrerythrin